MCKTWRSPLGGQGSGIHRRLQVSSFLPNIPTCLWDFSLDIAECRSVVHCKGPLWLHLEEILIKGREIFLKYPIFTKLLDGFFLNQKWQILASVLPIPLQCRSWINHVTFPVTWVYHELLLKAALQEASQYPSILTKQGVEWNSFAIADKQ